jgi:hypothetical protein
MDKKDFEGIIRDRCAECLYDRRERELKRLRVHVLGFVRRRLVALLISGALSLIHPSAFW